MRLPEIFVMTVEQCDMDNSGVRIPALARRIMPEFWAWPDKYERPKETNRSSINQRNREIIIEFRGNRHPSRLLGYVGKPEFRLRSEEINPSIKEIGDLLLLMQNPQSGADFQADVLHKDSPGYEKLMADCTFKAESSIKRFQYFDSDFKPCRPRRRFWTVILYQERETCWTSFNQKPRAEDMAKAIRKSNGEVEVVTSLEEIEF